MNELDELDDITEVTVMSGVQVSDPIKNVEKRSNSSDQLMDLVTKYDSGVVMTDEDLVNNYINPDLLNQVLAYNLKIAENGMLNSAKIIVKLENLVDELLVRIEDSSTLSDEELTLKLGLLFEMQSRYQLMIERVLSEDSYKYYLDNLSAVKRIVDMRSLTDISSVNREDIYSNAIDRKLVLELVKDVRNSINVSSDTYNEISGVTNRDSNE